MTSILLPVETETDGPARGVYVTEISRPRDLGDIAKQPSNTFLPAAPDRSFSAGPVTVLATLKAA